MTKYYYQHDAPVVMSAEVIQSQNTAYQDGLDIDQIRDNTTIIAKLNEQLHDTQEIKRVKRIDILNNLTPQQRRSFLLGEYQIDSEEEQQYYNVTNQEVETLLKTDSDYFVVYKVIDDVEIAYSLKVLFDNANVIVIDKSERPIKINSIDLPIEIDGNLYYYHVNPRTDKQWEYTVLSAQIEEYLDSMEDKTQQDDFNMIRETIKERLLSFGIMDNLSALSACDIIATNENIKNYKESDYTPEEICTSLIEKIINEFM